MPGELKPELSDVFQTPSHPGALWMDPPACQCPWRREGWVWKGFPRVVRIAPPAPGVQECPEPNVVMLMQQRWQEFGDEEEGEGKGRETGKPSLLGFGVGTKDARGVVEGHRM